MDADLMRTLTLASGADAVLSGRAAPDSFYPKHWVFQGFDRITFERPDSRRRLGTPKQWIGYLSKKGFHRAGVVTSQRPLPAGWAEVDPASPSEIWLLQCENADQSFFWTSDLLTGDEDPDSPSYRLVTETPVPREPLGLATAKKTLRLALQDILQFSKRYRVGFDGCFEKALRAIESSSPLKNCRYHPLVAARGYPLQARQLVAASIHAWVFGGMGSWSDIGVENPRTMRRYQAVTERLLAAIRDSNLASINSRLP